MAEFNERRVGRAATGRDAAGIDRTGDYDQRSDRRAGHGVAPVTEQAVRFLAALRVVLIHHRAGAIERENRSANAVGVRERAAVGRQPHTGQQREHRGEYGQFSDSLTHRLRPL